MSDEQAFEAWKRARAADAEPPDFPDRVMAAIEADEARVRPRGAARSMAAALLESPAARAAAMLLAAVVFLGRVASLFALFATP